MWIKIDNLMLDSLAVSADLDDNLSELLMRYLKVEPSDFVQYLINSKSVDARRGTPQLVYSIFVELSKEMRENSKLYTIVSKDDVDKKYSPVLELPENIDKDKKVVVIGTGPAGVFAALTLAKAGVKVLVLDRGFDVETRAMDQEKFLETRQLNTESNLLIGEGGAGTFSDGKLYTRTKDKLSNYVLKQFVDFGGSKDTMYLKRPHLGSDKLPVIAKNMRNEIEKLGGEFRFGSHVLTFNFEDDKLTEVVLNSGEVIKADYVLMAHGLGGRDLTRELIKKGVKHKIKSFQIGCRIEHPQILIDARQYRMAERFSSLPVAEYNMVSRLPKDNSKTKYLGVSSFCMCPGGEVVMASAWKNQLTTNGMSRYARDGEFANSCLIMTIDGERFGTADAAYKFLEKYEKGFFLEGDEDYTLVAQGARAFIDRRAGLRREETSSQTGIVSGRLDQMFTKDLYDSIVYALKDFEGKCPNFIAEGQLMGVETCISSPVRFVRNEETLSSSVENLYIAGEGAGCAGGIMSAAIDGIKLAMEISKKLSK